MRPMTKSLPAIALLCFVLGGKGGSSSLRDRGNKHVVTIKEENGKTKITHQVRPRESSHNVIYLDNLIGRHEAFVLSQPPRRPSSQSSTIGFLESSSRNASRDAERRTPATKSTRKEQVYSTKGQHTNGTANQKKSWTFGNLNKKLNETVKIVEKQIANNLPIISFLKSKWSLAKEKILNIEARNKTTSKSPNETSHDSLSEIDLRIIKATASKLRNPETAPGVNDSSIGSATLNDTTHDNLHQATGTPPGSELSAEAPPDLHQEQCKCGIPIDKKMKSGFETTISRFPWNVRILFKDYDKDFCGGTIINDRYVLTAAHCLMFTNPRELAVRIGSTNAHDEGQVIDAETLFIHRRYSANEMRNFDIALVKLKDKIKFSERALPICLSQMRNLNKKRGIATKWGKMHDAENETDTLTKDFMKIFEFRLCRVMSLYQRNDLHEGVICARGIMPNSCQGESGGPLVHYDGRRYSQVGIKSWGIGCSPAEYPGIYTKVPFYYSWIKAVARDGRYCD